MFISRNFFLAGGGPTKYKIIQEFTASGTWTAPAGVTSIDYLAVAGGGSGGGGPGGGGGGAGGYVAGTGLTVVPGTTYSITVGAGGAQVAYSTYGNYGSNTVAAVSNSYSFNGTNQYLSLASNAAFAFGTGDFTVELWYYLTVGSLPNTAIIDLRNGTNGGSVIQPLLEFQPTGSLGLNWYVGAGNRISSGLAAVKYNTWQHAAVCRSGGVTKMFIDGVQVGSTYTDANNYPAGSLTIGRSNDGASNRWFPGYISNLRIVKGTAAYTAAFTVPTTPLSATQNAGTNINAITGTQTSLLLGGIFLTDSSPVPLTITNNGSIVFSGISPFSLFSVIGGGRGAVGGIANNPGGVGGSGGGGGSGPSSGVIGSAGGSGTAGQGNAGGAGTQLSGAHQQGGGGGGAGGAGQNSSTGTGPAGDGGLSIASTLSGTSVYYAGGGGGGGHYTGTTRGGYGGGVTPARSGGVGVVQGTAGTAGTTNTGGGGGGGGDGGTVGYAGGSGIVILSYLAPKNTVFVYTATGVFKSPTTASTVEYLVVAGGGGAGGAGGGGAGGLLTGTLDLNALTNYTVTVGAGGAATASGSVSSFSSASSYGGGAGGSTPQNGGSGGGASYFNGAGGKGVYPGSTYISAARQGYDGGTGGGDGATTYGGGGGGGAGGVGGTRPTQNGGNGGVGLASAILTTAQATSFAVGQVSSGSVYFAGGGGGTGATSSGTGGLGGGATGNSTTATAGTKNTGGGGGGGNAGGPGGGGSGVVIIKLT